MTVSGEEAEVAHEALLREWPRLRGWLEEDAEGRRLHHHLGIAAREWDARGRDPASSTAARGSPPRSTGRPPTTPTSTRSSARSSTRAAPRRRARSAGCAPCWPPCSALLVARRGRRARRARSSAAARATQATAADAQRLGAARAARRPARPLAAARPPGRRARRHAADARQPAGRAAAQPGRDRHHPRRASADRRALAVSPDGRTLAVGNIAGEVLLFDTRTRRAHVATLEPSSNDPAMSRSPTARTAAGSRSLYTSEPGGDRRVSGGWRIVALVDRAPGARDRLATPRERPRRAAVLARRPHARRDGVRRTADLRRYDARHRPSPRRAGARSSTPAA